MRALWGLLALLAGPALGQGSALVKISEHTQGCDIQVTAQMRNCSVARVYGCDDGSHRAVYAMQNVPVSVERFGAGWTPELWVGLDGPGFMQKVAEQERFDLGALRQTGMASGAVTAAVDVGYFKGEVPWTVAGQLTGEAVQSNGRVYLLGKLQARLMMPQPYGTFELDYLAYVDRDRDVVLTSLERMAQGGQVQTFPAGMMEVTEGEGAGTPLPVGKFDCR